MSGQVWAVSCVYHQTGAGRFDAHAGSGISRRRSTPTAGVPPRTASSAPRSRVGVAGTGAWHSARQAEVDPRGGNVVGHRGDQLGRVRMAEREEMRIDWRMAMCSSPSTTVSSPSRGPRRPVRTGADPGGRMRAAAHPRPVRREHVRRGGAQLGRRQRESAGAG